MPDRTPTEIDEEISVQAPENRKRHMKPITRLLIILGVILVIIVATVPIIYSSWKAARTAALVAIQAANDAPAYSTHAQINGVMYGFDLLIHILTHMNKRSTAVTLRK